MSPRSSKKKTKKAKKSKKGGAAAPADVYISLLYLSVSFIVVGIIFLAMKLGQYGWAGT